MHNPPHTIKNPELHDRFSCENKINCNGTQANRTCVCKCHKKKCENCPYSHLKVDCPYANDFNKKLTPTESTEKCKVLIHAMNSVFCNEDKPCKWHSKVNLLNSSSTKPDQKIDGADIVRKFLSENKPDVWESEFKEKYKNRVMDRDEKYPFLWEDLRDFIGIKIGIFYNNGYRRGHAESLEHAEAMFNQGRQSAYREIMGIIEKEGARIGKMFTEDANPLSIFELYIQLKEKLTQK